MRDIIRDIDSSLGAGDSLGTLLKEIAEEYITVVEMLLPRGTKVFWEKSRKLYGSPKDFLFDDENDELNGYPAFFGGLDLETAPGPRWRRSRPRTSSKHSIPIQKFFPNQLVGEESAKRNLAPEAPRRAATS